MDPTLITVGILFLVGFFSLFLVLSKPSPESALLARVTNQPEAMGAVGAAAKWPGSLGKDRLGRFFGKVGQLLGGNSNPELVHRLSLAGYRKAAHADVFLGIRLSLPVLVGFTVAFFARENVIFLFILSAVASFFVPDLWLSRLISKRRESIRLSLPDALDLLAICMEAGLGLDQAIVRVGQEIRISHRALSDEFAQINYEQRAGNPRIEAWRRMAERTGVETVRSFVNMLVQTERFGTPISKSLGVFSDTLRTKRRQEAEEMAAKTTIKLVVPLVFFIFPSMFVVTVAPAVITIMKNIGKI